MSDSKPWTPRPDATSTSAKPPRRKRGWVWLLTAGGALSLGWVVSILIHGGLLGAAMFYTPFREAIFQPKRPETRVTASSQTIAEVAQIIRDENAQRLRSNLEHLQAVLAEMEKYRLEKFERYARFEQDLVSSAPRRALEAQDRALAAQDRTLAVQRSAPSAPATPRQALQQQSAGDQAQDEARQALELGGAALAGVAEAQQAARAAQEQAGSKQLAARQAAEQTENAQKQLQDAQEQVRQRREQSPQKEEQQRQLREWEQRQDERRQAHQTAQQTLDRLQQEATQTQQAARDQQQAARDALAKAVAESVQIARQPTAPTPHRQTLTPMQLGPMELAELYQRSRQTETQITESFRELRAAELAMIREIRLDEAIRSTDVPKPIRPDLDAALLNGAARDTATLAKQKEQVQAAVRQSESMVDLAYNLIWMAAATEGEGREGGATVRALPRPVDTGMTAEQFQQVAQAAGEDEAAVAKDLTGLMTPGGGAAAQGENINLEGEQPGKIVLIKSPGAPDGPPIIDQRNMGIVLPARRITASGRPVELVIVDSWYVIGPFDNPERKNINQAFPPESVVDLDAVYAGMGGKPVRWQFVQSSGPEIQPPDMRSYAIYYAYAELFFEQEQDLWIAVGSDDYSKLWINGHLVWASGMQHKGWRVNEGWRKVHFGKGINRILYRVENGWMGMGWSLVIYTQPIGSAR